MHNLGEGGTGAAHHLQIVLGSSMDPEGELREVWNIQGAAVAGDWASFRRQHLGTNQQLLVREADLITIDSNVRWRR